MKITFLYKLVARKLDFILSKLQILIWKDTAFVAWKIEDCPIHSSVKAAMFFGSPEHLTFWDTRSCHPTADKQKGPENGPVVEWRGCHGYLVELQGGDVVEGLLVILDVF